MIKLANGWTLRLRQEECHDKVIDSYKKGEREFIIAANCRFGKTITTLQTLRDLADDVANGDQLVLVVSTMSVKKEWTDGAKATGFDTSLLDKEINDINFNVLSESGRHVIYCSTQKLGNESPKSIELLKWFNNHAGLRSLVYDECHLGSGTERTDNNILSRLRNYHKVYLSGTPYRNHLKKEFCLDTVEGDDKSYMYTIMDEREDYKNGLITDYTPVQLEMHVLDYAKDIDSLVDEGEKDAIKYGVSSAYFKKIFSDSNYKSYAIEFLDKIIDFAKLKNIKNFLFFVPLRKVGTDLVHHFEKIYKDRIKFRNLCGDYVSDDTTESEDEKLLETEAEKLNEFYSTDEGVIKIGITCNKCGTGTTLKHLDAVAFLKDTTDAISFIQKSQRVRTPEEGKTIGYCLCFNQWQGLKAFCDYAKATVKPNEKGNEATEKEAFQKAIENGAVRLILNLTEIKDYASIIDIINTYRPGQRQLFDDFDFGKFSPDVFKFYNDLKSIEDVKKDLLNKNPDLRNSDEIKDAKDAEELERALRNAGKVEEADEIKKRVVDYRQCLEDSFVDTIGYFRDSGDSVNDVMNIDSYSEEKWKYAVEGLFGPRDAWTYILKHYPRYVPMIYKYFDEKID